MADAFDDLESQMSAGGADAVLGRLSERLRDEKKFHELFDAMLMQTRRKLGLPAVLTQSLDELAEPVRNQVEEGYLAACREVGALLLNDGKFREAWMYLRPTGDKTTIAKALESTEPDDDNLQDLIEIALHEGVSPALGYKLVLENYGTCNAITTYDGVVSGRPRVDQQAASTLLVEHLHAELLVSVAADIERQEGSKPTEKTLKELVADRDWLFGEHNYHVDTTHLAAVTRFARVIDDPKVLRLALDLTEYGRRLSSQFQFAGDEPFVDLYPSHALFFSALLGERVDEALEYFRKKAEEVDPHEDGTLAAETYISLLARLGKNAQAVAAAAKLLPPGTRTTGLAPSLFELSRQAGDFGPLKAASRERGDLVSFAAGLIGG